MGGDAPLSHRRGPIDRLTYANGVRAPRQYVAGVPTYHLHLINAFVDADDAEGLDLASLDEARAKAIEGIRGFLGHEVAAGVLDLRGRIDIEDDGGAVLATIAFGDAVTVRTA